MAKIYANTELNWKDLLEMPVNSMFYEIDLPTEPVFIKTANAAGPYKGKDIRVMPLHNDNDGQSRLGLAEMDAPTRNSKRWHRLNEEDINTMMGRLMLAAV